MTLWHAILWLTLICGIASLIGFGFFWVGAGPRQERGQ